MVAELTQTLPATKPRENTGRTTANSAFLILFVAVCCLRVWTAVAKSHAGFSSCRNIKAQYLLRSNHSIQPGMSISQRQPCCKTDATRSCKCSFHLSIIPAAYSSLKCCRFDCIFSHALCFVQRSTQTGQFGQFGLYTVHIFTV